MVISMNKVKISFLLFLFILSFMYMSDIFKNVDILSFLLENNRGKKVVNVLSKGVLESPINMLDIESDKNLKVSNNNKKNTNSSNTKKIKNKEKIEINNKPLVYIYNTHEAEEYKKSVYNITPTVKTVSSILYEELEKMGIGAIKEERPIIKEVNKRGLDYTGTYAVSFEYLKDVKSKNPSIKMFFDMHRDSVKGSAAHISIKGKDYAKMMFLVGTKNKNYKKNVKHLKVMKKYLDKHYPNLVRDTYYQSHSAFNQFYDEGMFLIELGGPDNTLEEIYNTTLALSKSIDYYLKENGYEK